MKQYIKALGIFLTVNVGLWLIINFLVLMDSLALNEPMDWRYGFFISLAFGIPISIFSLVTLI